jgi:hypothetical protein
MSLEQLKMECELKAYSELLSNLESKANAESD